MFIKYPDSYKNRSQVDSISLDFSRAFDVVPHNRLLLKMDYYGIRKILPWISDFLSNRNQVVVMVFCQVNAAEAVT